MDGKAIKEGQPTISLPAGNHTVGCRELRYKILSQRFPSPLVRRHRLAVNLEAYGEKVPGPYGYIMIEFKPQAKAAVF